MDENRIAYQVIGAAIEVHKVLGPGLLESAYQSCLIKELELMGIEYEAEAPITLEYKGEFIENAYRVDLYVENKIIVELKTVEELTDKHKAQLLTYLRLADRKLGLLINFNEVMIKNGIRRVVNKL